MENISVEHLENNTKLKSIFWCFFAIAIVGCQNINTTNVLQRITKDNLPAGISDLRPIFYFEDAQENKRYFIRASNDVEVVSIKRGQEPEVLATPIEREYALAKLEYDWREKSLDEKLNYHRNIQKKELEKDIEILRTEIIIKKRIIQQLQDTKNNIDIRIRADQDCEEKSEIGSLKQHSEEIAREIRIKVAELELLEYERVVKESLKDGKFIIRILDIGYPLNKEKLINDIKMFIEPKSWQDPHVRLEIKDNFLIIKNTKQVVEKVKDYLDILDERGEISKFSEEKIDIEHILKFYRSSFEDPQEGEKKLLEDIKKNVGNEINIKGTMLKVSNNKLLIRNRTYVIKKVKNFLDATWEQMVH